MISPHLFSPLQLREVQFRNRIGVSPMCQYSSEDGFANDWHLVHLGSRAVGGAAMVLTEAAAVTPEGRISPDDLGIWKDEQIEMLARIFHFVEAQGAVSGMQLAHAGFKASTSAPRKGHEPIDEARGGWQPIFGASARPFDAEYQTPVALDPAGIDRVIRAFAEAAQRCEAAGGRVIEVHAAHGYLLHEFLSPLTNTRDDEFGGTFDNRIRLLCRVVEAVRAVWPERFPLFVRISASDWIEGGWTGEDSVVLGKRLQSLGVDLIDCSTGGAVPKASIPTGPGYQVRFARAVKEHAGIATAAVGMITSPAQADQIIREGQADMILMAREFLRDPYWPLHAARILGHEPSPPAQYGRAFLT
ncbi:MAG: NADH:flavin oxidoreductase/NADH oxidase [Verrucomicrobiota bacterium]|nr:NADH:flavin oxidoreductase/NADH oxidase [Verrucomicrobiota bacterium]